MRKHNRYIPPALKHNSRQNNSVVLHQSANAQRAKAGLFAKPLILPGEDRREFEALHPL